MKNKKLKDTDYIELEKSEYKNKNSIYRVIILLILLTLVIFFLFNDDKFFNNVKSFFFIKTQNESSEIVKLDSENDYLSNSEAMDLFQERDLNAQILDEKNNENQEKINILEFQISKLQEQLNDLSQKKNISESKKSESISPNKAYVNFLLLHKKLFSNDIINKELEFLELYFFENKKIKTLLEYFESIERLPLNNFELIVELDSLAQQFNPINFNKSDKVFSDYRWQESIKSREGFKTNLMNFIDTNFKIRKIDQDADLNDYIDINNDGNTEAANSLMEIRSKLLLNDLKEAKTISEKMSPLLNFKLEIIIEKINELLIFNENIQKLEEEILVSILKT